MRVALFFDGLSFHSGWMDWKQDAETPVRLDFQNLSEWLVDSVRGDTLWGAYYYTGIEPGEGNDRDGQSWLRRHLEDIESEGGYFVRSFQRKTRTNYCPHCDGEIHYTTEKEVDTSIVADMLRLAAVDAFDVAILLSGDSDLAPAVDGVRTLGKQVYVATWMGRGLSPRIRHLAFDHIDLSTGTDEFVVKESSPTDPYAPPPTDGELEAFLDALALAEARFEGGYVGVNYFLRNWESESLPADFGLRARILDVLREEEQVDIYESSDGNQALRRHSQLSVPDPATI